AQLTKGQINKTDNTHRHGAVALTCAMPVFLSTTLFTMSGNSRFSMAKPFHQSDYSARLASLNI
ncbi:MAG: hypothetical protein K2K22_03435, partial [Muribaculaceae bacterium]|nr:hypothetical protein [Muribaculaceae bacterium]